METTHEPLHLKQMKSGIVQIKGIPTSCTWTNILFDETFKICLWFEILRSRWDKLWANLCIIP
jgi:hypothetical protein